MFTRQGIFAGAIVVSIAAAALAGCDTASPSASSTPPSGSSATSATSTTTKVALPNGGKCVLLTIDQATTLLGGKPDSSSSGVTGDKIVHVDGCLYTGAPVTLGYDVNDYAGSGFDPKTVVQQGQVVLNNAPGAQKFDAALGDSALAFTMPIAGKIMARLEIAKGTFAVSVNAVAADAGKAKEAALAAAAILLAAIG